MHYTKAVAYGVLNLEDTSRSQEELQVIFDHVIRELRVNGYQVTYDGFLADETNAPVETLRKEGFVVKYVPRGGAALLKEVSFYDALRFILDYEEPK